jgi:hypothetical protein
MKYFVLPFRQGMPIEELPMLNRGRRRWRKGPLRNQTLVVHMEAYQPSIM